MKFSDIAKEEWDGLKPYLDTCLLPVTGLTGREGPHEVTERLERLRDLMDHAEIPFKGRVVTYPAHHYTGGAAGIQWLNEICRELKEGAGFRYVLLMSAAVPLDGQELPAADLVIHVGAEQLLQDPSAVRAQISGEIGALWLNAGDAAKKGV